MGVSQIPIEFSGPRGEVGYQQVTANQTITTLVDLTGLTVTFTIPSGQTRIIHVLGEISCQSTVAGDSIRLLITLGDNSGLQFRDTGAMSGASSLQGLSANFRGIFSAGTHTVKLRGQRVSGSGTSTLVAGAPFPAFILVKDIGPG